METLATLAMDIDVKSADPAEAKLKSLKQSAKELEDQAGRTSAAAKSLGEAQGLAGTAAGRAEKMVRQYGTGLSEQASLMLRNAQLQANWAKEAEKASAAGTKAQAAAEKAAAREAALSFSARSALTKQRVAEEQAAAAIEQTLVKRNADFRAAMLVQEARAADQAAKAEAAAAREAQAAIEAGDRAAERSAQQVAAFRLRMARQRVAEEGKAAQESAQTQAAAAAQVASLSRQYDGLRASLDPFAAVQLRLTQNTRLLDDALAHGVITARQYEDALSQVTRAATSDLLAIDNLNKAHGSATGSSRTLSFAMLNLSRQASDLGVGFAAAATSSKPFQMVIMTLIQQGPQVVDVFADLKTQGVGVKSALAEMGAAARGLIVTFGPWIAGLAAVGAGVFYLVDQHNKQAKAIKDLNKDLKEQNKELAQISPYLAQAGAGADLAADGLRNYDNWLRTSNVSLEQQNKLLRENALRKLNEKAMAAAEKYSAAQQAFDRVNKPGPTMMSSGGAGGFGVVAPAKASDPKANPFYKEAAENLKIAKEAYEAVNKYRNEAYTAPAQAFAAPVQAATAKAATAVRDLSKAVEVSNETVSATTIVWPEAAAAAQAYEKQQRALKDAANDNIKAFEEQTRGLTHFSDWLERVTLDLEDAAAVSRGLSYDIDDIARSINDNDWTSAFAGLSRVLMQVKAAFDQGATSAQKYAAAAGVAQAVGGAVGGTGGAAISGAASGAMAGFTIAGPAGAVVGGILGGIGGILGSSKAKKRARQQAEAQRLAEEQQRQDQIASYTSQFEIDTLRASGNEGAAVAMERSAELAALAKLSPALADLKQKYYDAADAATAAANAAEKAAQVEARRSSIQDEIDKLTLSSADLLAKARGKERAEAVALDPALGDLIDKLFGLQDAASAAAIEAEALAAAQDEKQRIEAYLLDEQTKAVAAQTAAADQVADALKSAASSLGGVAKSLRELAGDLSDQLGLTDGYDAAKANLLKNSGNLYATQGNIEAFLKASQARYGDSREYLRDAALGRSLALQTADNADWATKSWSSKLAWLNGTGSLPGFANGGAMQIAGNPGVDQNVVSVNNVPVARVNMGETMAFIPQGQANDNGTAGLIGELRALRQEVASLRAEAKRGADNTEENTATLKNGIISTQVV